MVAASLAVTWLLGCSASDAVRLTRAAVTGDATAARQVAVEKATRYATRPDTLKRDIERFHNQFAAIIEAFRKGVRGRWGDKESREPEQKKYVKYTQNYLSRASVDFDRGVVTVETLDGQNPEKSLKAAVVTTLLTPNDPRAVDLYTAGTVTLGGEPFLLGEVLDHEGQPIRWTWRAERFADHLIGTRMESRAITVGGKAQSVHGVSLAMVRDHLTVRAKKYRTAVDRFATQYKVSRNLIYAIMKTESDFNPFAVSPAPAFGLMQIVPDTAGSDVNRLLHRSGVPDRNTLFDPEENIRYGTAYLHLLTDRYLAGIENPVSRQYCVITAYNAGAGNVLKTFHQDREKATSRINALAPLTVFNTLHKRLPVAEGRRYLAKVTDAQKAFVNF
ncbi:MAG: DUF3393 domain-containing protein [Desulfobacterales bacterium]|nr:DUF3393 domain-containing protein [Desulfobacterales bacterium]